MDAPFFAWPWKYLGSYKVLARMLLFFFSFFFDVLGNTIDERYWNLHKETSSGAGRDQLVYLIDSGSLFSVKFKKKKS